MIARADLPSISSVLPRLDIPIGRGGRTICPIHRGKNRQAFSYNDQKGIWHCFRCGEGGDVVRLVERSLDTDFRGALRFLEIEKAHGANQKNHTAADTNLTREQDERRLHWAELIERERELREEFRLRTKIARLGGDRLREDPDSAIAWDLLATAYSGTSLDLLEAELDQLLAEIPRDAYPRPEDMPGYELGKLLAAKERRRAA